MDVDWAAKATGPRLKIREARRLLLGLTTVLGASVLGGCWPTADDGPSAPDGVQIGVRTTAQQVVRVYKSDARRRFPAAVQLKAPRSTQSAKTDRLPVGPMWTYPRNEPLLPRLAERRFPPYVPEPRAPAVVGRGSTELAKFFSALNDLEAGSRREPVTILHLGDSHIASDRFSGDVRDMLQKRFGDAGRGALMPGYPFRGYRARGVKFGKTGKWSTATSLKKKDKGPYGITGVRLTANGKGSELRLDSKNGPFEWADVTFLAGPRRGKAVISIDDGTRAVDTRAKAQASKHVHIDQKGTQLKIRTTGGGKVSVLSWAIGYARPGVRYINFGIPSATVEITERWDKDLVTKDVEAIKPDLIVLGYGTNEGFNDGLKLAAYKEKFRSFIDIIKAAAPNAELVFIGPADGARLPKFARSRKKSAGCRALSDDEKKNYRKIYRARDKRVRQWHAPPKLSAVRHAIAELSKEYGGFYWDWSAMMGGECGIHKWVKSDPKLAMSDHVHITADGSRKSAKAFFKDLMAAYEAHRQVASR